jgi:hypothetical protein
MNQSSNDAGCDGGPSNIDWFSGSWGPCLSLSGEVQCSVNGNGISTRAMFCYDYGRGMNVSLGNCSSPSPPTIQTCVLPTGAAPLNESCPPSLSYSWNGYNYDREHGVYANTPFLMFNFSLDGRSVVSYPGGGFTGMVHCSSLSGGKFLSDMVITSPSEMKGLRTLTIWRPIPDGFESVGFSAGGCEFPVESDFSGQNPRVMMFTYYRAGTLFHINLRITSIHAEVGGVI